MTDVRDTIERSRRHHQAETAGGGERIPGQTLGHFGGGLDVHLAYCKEDAGASSSIACWLDYRERNVQVWRNVIPFAAGQIATYADKFWLSKENNNTGNIPAENTHWTEVTAYNEATTYNITTAIWCLYDNKLWRSLQAGNIGHIPTEGAWWTTKAPAYAGGTAYLVGGRAIYGGKLYRCIQACTGKTPATEPLYWTEILEIEVHCTIACGSKLQFAIPLLLEQQAIEIEYNSAHARYEAKQLFQACEETAAEGALLEIVNEMTLQDFVTEDNSFKAAQFGGHGLRIAAEVHSTYVIEFAIIYTSSSDTNGIKLQVNGPSSPVSISGIFYGTNDAGFTGFPISAYTTPVTFSKNSSGIKFIRGDFVLKTGANAGEFCLEFATEVAHPATVTILIGSNIKSRRTQWELPV